MKWVSSVTKFAVCMALSLISGANAIADISYNTAGSVYQQNFDSLLNTGTANAWTNDSTISGWSLFNSTNAAITTYRAGIGDSNTGSFYSFGSAGGSERSLGATASGGAYFGNPGTGAVAGHIAVSFNNATASTLSSFSVTYDGEQWRNGGNANAQSLTFSYGFGTLFTDVSSWNSVNALVFTSPVVGATAAAVDGNTAGRIADISSSITGITWNSGETLWLRWTDLNDAGNDHGLAIDNVRFSAVPEPASMLLLGVAGIGGFAFRRFRRKSVSETIAS